MIVSSKFSRWQWLFMETTFYENNFSWNRYFMKMTFQGQSDSGRGSSMLSGEEGNRQPNGLQVSRWQLIVLKLQLCFFSMAIKKKIKNYEQNGGLRSYASSRDILDLYGQVTIGDWPTAEAYISASYCTELKTKTMHEKYIGVFRPMPESNTPHGLPSLNIITIRPVLEHCH